MKDPADANKRVKLAAQEVSAYETILQKREKENEQNFGKKKKLRRKPKAKQHWVELSDIERARVAEKYYRT